MTLSPQTCAIQNADGLISAGSGPRPLSVSYTHLTLPTTPYV